MNLRSTGIKKPDTINKFEEGISEIAHKCSLLSSWLHYLPEIVSAFSFKGLLLFVCLCLRLFHEEPWRHAKHGFMLSQPLYVRGA